MHDVFCMCVIAATEWIGVSKRSFGVCVTLLLGAVGQCVLAGVIYLIRDWRLAQLTIACAYAVIVIYIWCALTLFNSPLLFHLKMCDFFINQFIHFCQVYSRISQMVVKQRKDGRGQTADGQGSRHQQTNCSRLSVGRGSETMNCNI